MGRQHLITEPYYGGQSIRADRTHPVIKEVVVGFQQRLDYMNRKHAQTFVVNCIARFPQGCQAKMPNQSVSNTLRKFRAKAKREGMTIQAGWTREQDTSTNPHYHIGIICDGTKTQNGYKAYSWLNSIWSKEIDAPLESRMVSLCKPNPQKSPVAQTSSSSSTGIKIIRGSSEEKHQLENVLNWLSYNAKTNQKGKAPSRQREYNFTRLSSV
jgi:hypothetical protein